MGSLAEVFAQLPIDRAGMLNGAIHAIYESAVESEPWRAGTALISEYLACTSTTLIVRPGTATDPGYVVCHPANGEAMAIANQTHRYRCDPFADLPPNRVMLISDIMSNQDWQNSQFVREYHGVGMPTDADHAMGIDIATDAGTVSKLRLYRFQDMPAFDVEDRRRLEILVPHIRQALALSARMRRNEVEREIYEEGLDRLNIGVVLLDDGARLLRANPVACHILNAGDGLHLSGRELETCTAAETRELRRLLGNPRSDSSTVSAMSVSRPSGRRKMAVVVRSIPMVEESDGRAQPAYAVFLRDPDAQAGPAQELTRQLFDFTPAEANFAVELVNGLSLDEAAVKLGIRRNTARAHLRAIFMKAGVTRQSELVRVLLNAVLGQCSPS